MDSVPTLVPGKFSSAELEPVAALGGHTETVWHVSWSPTRQLLASCGGDRSVRIWAMDAAFARRKAAEARSGSSSTPDSSKASKKATASSASGARSAASAGAGGTAGAGGAGAGSGASPAVDETPEQARERIAAGWRCVEVLDGVATRTVRSCEWSPCGRYLATASFDGSVHVWEVQRSESELIATLEGHENEVKCVAWSADGGLLASCGRDKSVWIWDATEAEEGGEYECVSVLNGHSADVKFVAFHPTHRLLVSASYDDTVRVWEEADDDWICTDTLSGHTSTVWQVCFNVDGKRLATCSDDLSVKVWHRLPGGADGSMRYRCVATLANSHDRTIYSIDWCPKSGFIATGGADDSVRLIEEGEGSTTADPTFLHAGSTTAAHQGDVNCVRWHPRDAGLLATAGDDCLVRLWRHKPAGSV